MPQGVSDLSNAGSIESGGNDGFGLDAREIGGEPVDDIDSTLCLGDHASPGVPAAVAAGGVAQNQAARGQASGSGNIFASA